MREHCVGTIRLFSFALLWGWETSTFCVGNTRRLTHTLMRIWVEMVDWTARKWCLKCVFYGKKEECLHTRMDPTKRLNENRYKWRLGNFNWGRKRKTNPETTIRKGFQWYCNDGPRMIVGREHWKESWKEQGSNRSIIGIENLPKTVKRLLQSETPASLWTIFSNSHWQFPNNAPLLMIIN